MKPLPSLSLMPSLPLLLVVVGLLFCLNACQPTLSSSALSPPPLPLEPPEQPRQPEQPFAAAGSPAPLSPQKKPSLPASMPIPALSQLPPSHRAPSYQRLRTGSLTIDLLDFDARSHHLAVVDQTSLGGQWRSAKEVAEDSKQGGLAAINAGFFQPDASPLGLVISEKRRAGTWTTSSSLTSGVFAFDGRAMRLTRAKALSPSLRQKASHLLQAGPFLLEKGRLISGLSPQKPAMRSLLLTDHQGRWAIALTSSTSLRDLAKALQSPAIQAFFPVSTALNLDGGRSCDLFIGDRVQGGPVLKSHWLKSAVRNYLVLRPNSLTPP